MPYTTIEATFEAAATEALYTAQVKSVFPTAVRLDFRAKDWFQLDNIRTLAVHIPAGIAATVTSLRLQYCLNPLAAVPVWVDCRDELGALVEITGISTIVNSMYAFPASVRSMPGALRVRCYNVGGTAEPPGAMVMTLIAQEGDVE